MKKKLFFAIDSLDVAGAEKSLITLLSLLDYNKYEVDLQLFSYGNELERLLPKEVNLLPPLSYTMFSQSDLITSIKQSFKKREFNMLSSRFHYSFSIRRKNYRNSQKARIYWQSASKVIEKKSKKL
ncbi:hypothetical protein [Halobacillus andaensis]|uniref:hypothetical protein n=1 Tax=Halobacillus andaensis TaxID=1176239 RepID=UPI003D760B4B